MADCPKAALGPQKMVSKLVEPASWAGSSENSAVLPCTALVTGPSTLQTHAPWLAPANR